MQVRRVDPQRGVEERERARGVARVPRELRAVRPRLLEARVERGRARVARLRALDVAELRGAEAHEVPADRVLRRERDDALEVRERAAVPGGAAASGGARRRGMMTYDDKRRRSLTCEDALVQQPVEEHDVE